MKLIVVRGHGKAGTDSDGMEDAVTVEEDGSSEEVGAEMEKGQKAEGPSAGSVF